MKKLLDSFAYKKLPLLSAVASASFLSAQSSSLSSYRPVLLDLIKSSTVLMSLPFSVGDCISVNSAKGKVSDISLRYIALDAKDAITYIPTHLLYNSVIKKFK